MIENPQVISTAEQTIAFIPVTATWDDIQEVMGPGLNELRTALEEQSILPSGPWFAHHNKRPTDSFDFEICIPVVAQVKPVGRVKAGKVPALKVARTIYHGGYEEMGKAWGEFTDWLDASGLNLADDFYECYLVGPEVGSDSSVYRTQFSRPVRS